MELIQENIAKQRKVYKKDNNTVRKIWYNTPGKNFGWLEEQSDMIEKVNPGYVKEIGYEEDNVWMDMQLIPGTVANKFDHSKDFILKMHNFAKNHYQETKPYAHGDWVTSNIIIDGDTIKMVDWDGIGKYPDKFVNKKIIKDLKKAKKRYYLGLKQC